MDLMEGSTNTVQLGPTPRSHWSSVSSVGARAADLLVCLWITRRCHWLWRVCRHSLPMSCTVLFTDIALEAFVLYLVSPLLEVQLKPRHQPYKLGHQWPELLLRFTDAPEDEVAMDEPSLQFLRNVFFSKLELQVQDPEMLHLLYKEAKANVLGA